MNRDYAWLRSRQFRHRQAHYYDMEGAMASAVSACRRYRISLRGLTAFKEYNTMPSNVCSTCVLAALEQAMWEIGA